MFRQGTLRAQFRAAAFNDVGGVMYKGHRIERERLIFFAAPKSSRARGSSVGGSAARRWRRRHLLREAAAPVSPPSVRSAGGGGMFGAHGKIAYLSLLFCALMRALSARGDAAVPLEESRRRRKARR